MHSLERLISLISGLSNVALAVLTAVYVLLTRKLLLQGRDTQEQAEIAFRTQIHYAILPQLHLEAGDDALTGRWLSVSNWSPNTAIDLDFWIVTPYSEQEREPFRQQLKPSEERNWKFDEEGLSYVWERCMYRAVAGHHKVLFRIPLPESTDFKCFYQFRNASGQNYSSLIWFYRSTRDASRFVIGSVEPEVPLASDRLVFNGQREITGRLPLGKKSDFQRYFLPSLKIAMSWSGLVGISREGDVDDCGELERLIGGDEC